jgi:hypothetical protein
VAGPTTENATAAAKVFWEHLHSTIHTTAIRVQAMLATPVVEIWTALLPGVLFVPHQPMATPVATAVQLAPVALTVAALVNATASTKPVAPPIALASVATTTIVVKATIVIITLGQVLQAAFVCLIRQNAGLSQTTQKRMDEGLVFVA